MDEFEKYIDIKFDNATPIWTRALIEALLSNFMDFAYGYDIEEEAFQSIIDTLEENGIEYEIKER